MKTILFFLGIRSGFLFLFMGCTAPTAPRIETGSKERPIESVRTETVRPGAKPPSPRSMPEGVSVEGRPISLDLHGYGADRLLIIGGIHGNEPAGTELVRALTAYLDIHPLELRGLQVVSVPAANPDGLVKNRRCNAHGVDLNRNYETGNRKNSARFGREPLSEPEARFLVEAIEYFQPVRILSIHQPMACVDWDGPARSLAEILAKTSGLPLKKIGALPGSLGSYAGNELGIPIITLELPGKASDLDQEALWERYGESVLRFLRGD
ncbi:MAG: DUF2817 domain-containing protein [Planctomycetes bacterium]|nr:DUF2817 domain-containing protein [Planctomycetota bacterium]